MTNCFVCSLERTLRQRLDSFTLGSVRGELHELCERHRKACGIEDNPPCPACEIERSMAKRVDYPVEASTHPLLRSKLKKVLCLRHARKADHEKTVCKTGGKTSDKRDVRQSRHRRFNS